MPDIAVVTDPWFYAVAVPAVLLMGLSKSGYASGFGSLATPMIAITVGVPQAAAIMLPLLMVLDVFAVGRYRRDWSRAHMPILLAGGAIGTLLGYLAFKHLDELWVRLLIGCIAVSFGAQHLGREFLGHVRVAPEAPAWPKGVFWSSVSGVTSFLANAGGPPLQVYLQPYRLDKTVFVATISVFFWIVNALKFFPFVHLGLFTFENLGTSVVLLPLAILGIWLGFRIHDRVDQKRFYLWCNLFLFLTGWKLVYDGARGLFFA
jgi:uncharacterized membrane protein YfcA